MASNAEVADEIRAAAAVVEDARDHMSQLANEADELVTHLGALVRSLDEALENHAAVYDMETQTGDTTRAQIQGAKRVVEEQQGAAGAVKDELQDNAGVLTQAADDMRAHAARIMEAGQS